MPGETPTPIARLKAWLRVPRIPWDVLRWLALEMPGGIAVGFLIARFSPLTVSFVVVGLLLILINGYLVSVFVRQRVEPISEIPQTVQTTLDQRLPPIRFVEGHDATVAAMLTVIEGSETFIAATGGRSIEIPYLNAIERRLREKDGMVYYRIILGEELTPELCTHLRSLLCDSTTSTRTFIGRFARTDLGYFTVTDAGAIVYIPDPLSSHITKCLHVSALYGHPARADLIRQLASYVTSYMWGEAAKGIDTPAKIQALCAKCRRGTPHS